MSYKLRQAEIGLSELYRSRRLVPNQMGDSEGENSIDSRKKDLRKEDSTGA